MHTSLETSGAGCNSFGLRLLLLLSDKVAWIKDEGISFLLTQ